MPQLLLCWNPEPAKVFLVGAGAAVFPVQSGLAVKATASDHGHPVLPRGVAAITGPAKMLRQPPVTTQQLRSLESLTLVPHYGLDDGEWPEPSGKPQRAGTDPCQHLQKAGCVATCLGCT